MTACKDSLNGKKAVSATLAGVLAVGMVPAAAFAETAQADTTGEQGIDLLLNDQIEAFNNGSVTPTGLSKDADNTYYVEATGKAITNVTANSVYPKGSDEAITITDNEDSRSSSTRPTRTANRPVAPSTASSTPASTSWS